MASLIPLFHIEIHLHRVSGVNEVFAHLALKLFGDARSVTCVQLAALRLFFLNEW